MSASGLYFLDGLDLYDTYGFVPDKHCSDNILQPPVVKEPYSNNWAEEDNLEFDETDTPVYEDRTITLTGHIIARSERLFWEKYTALKDVLRQSGTRLLTVTEIATSVNVFYKSMSPVVKLTKIKGTSIIGCKVEIILQEVQSI